MWFEGEKFCRVLKSAWSYSVITGIVVVLVGVCLAVPASAESITLDYNDQAHRLKVDGMLVQNKLYVDKSLLDVIGTIDPDHGTTFENHVFEKEATVDRGGRTYVSVESITQVLKGAYHYDGYYKKLYLRSYPFLDSDDWYGLKDIYGNPVPVPGLVTGVRYLGHGMVKGKDDKGHTILATIGGKVVRDFGIESDENCIDLRSYGEGLAPLRIYTSKWVFAPDGGHGETKTLINCFIRLDGSAAFDIPKDMHASDFEEGYSRMSRLGDSDHIRVIDKKNKVIFDGKAQQTYAIGGGILRVYVNDSKQFLILPDGSRTDISKYSDVGLLSDGLIHVCKKGMNGFIDPKGKEVIPCIYRDSQSAFGEGLVGVSDGKKSWFIDRNNKKVMSLESKYWIPYGGGYEGFSEGLTVIICLKKSLKGVDGWVYMDRKGKIVLGPYKARPHPFEMGIAMQLEEKPYDLYYIDKSGKRLVQK